MGAEDRTSARRSGVKKREMTMVNTMNKTEPLVCLCPFGTVSNRQRQFGYRPEGRAQDVDSHMNYRYPAAYVAQGVYSRWRVKKG